MKAIRDLKRWVERTLFLFLALALTSSPLFAGELEGKDIAPNISNIGFMENPPSALKEKFPMCDAFLKVEWIDKEKKIGYSRYDIYDGKGNKVPPQATALIDLDEYHPSFDYAVSKYLQHDDGVRGFKYQYLPEGKLQELFHFIKEGEIHRADWGLRIINGKRTIKFISIGEVRDEDLHYPFPYDISLAGHRQNVCIPFPDNQRMWIAERRRIENMYSKEESAKLFTKLKILVPKVFPPDSPGFGNGFVLDINFDGIEDYFVGEYVYSYGTTYYATVPAWERERWSGLLGQDLTVYKWQSLRFICPCVKFLQFVLP